MPNDHPASEPVSGHAKTSQPGFFHGKPFPMARLFCTAPSMIYLLYIHILQPSSHGGFLWNSKHVQMRSHCASLTPGAFFHPLSSFALMPRGELYIFSERFWICCFRHGFLEDKSKFQVMIHSLCYWVNSPGCRGREPVLWRMGFHGWRRVEREKSSSRKGWGQDIEPGGKLRGEKQAEKKSF